MRTFQRVVAVVCVAGVLSSCAVTRRQRTVAVAGTTIFTVATAGYAFSRMLARCPPGINGASDACEADRIDDRNLWAGISLLGLVATISALALPVSDPERPPPSAVTVAPPPPPPASASALHSPVAVNLAQQARTQAAAGQCVEALGTLRALATIDRGLADQLRAWDPTVSRCRTASQAGGSQTAVEAPRPAPVVGGPGAH